MMKGLENKIYGSRQKSFILGENFTIIPKHILYII